MQWHKSDIQQYHRKEFPQTRERYKKHRYKKNTEHQIEKKLLTLYNSFNTKYKEKRQSIKSCKRKKNLSHIFVKTKQNNR